MSTRRDLFLIVVVLPVTVAFATLAGAGLGEPSENDLRFWFDRNRSSFERLRTLIEEPPEIDYLDLESNDGRFRGAPVGPVDWRQPRLAEIRSLMRWTGTEQFNAGLHGGQLMSWMSPGGFKGQSVKGYAFGRPDYGPVVTSVDVAGRERYLHTGARRIFSQLGNGWFVYYDFGD